ncbi:MAG TPA: phosphopantetheine-binding protein, partial [Longimicrobium sp.]
PNGKVDRRALESLETSPLAETAAPSAAPRTWIEEQLAAIWRELLESGPVGIHDDFFALGGHSLRATRVTAHVGKALGVDVPLRALFETPTLAAFAAQVDACDAAASATGILSRGGAQAALASVDELSEDELDRLLAELATEEDGDW